MTRTVVGIDGMACSMCESHVNDTVRRNFHVKSVKASHKKKQGQHLLPLLSEKLFGMKLEPGEE